MNITPKHPTPFSMRASCRLLLLLISPAGAALASADNPAGLSVELIPGKVLWLRGDGYLAPEWPDVSGKSNHPIQVNDGIPAADVATGFNSHRAVIFSGTEHFALPDLFGAAAEGQVFTVLRTGVDTTLDGLWRFGRGPSFYSSVSGVMENFGFNIPYALPFSLLPDIPLDSPHLYEAQCSYAAGWAIRFNTIENLGYAFGEGEDQYIGFDPTPLLGHNGETAFSGEIAEILVFDRVLTPGQRALVNRYLITKYALPVTLPEDTDGDGLDDTAEAAIGTLSTVADTDGDGMSDGDEVAADRTPLAADPPAHPDDLNGNGLSDAWEIAQGWTVTPGLVEPGRGAQDDADGDGMTNLQEYQSGTNPTLADTDGDGMSDGDEVAAGRNPLAADTQANPGDMNGNGLPDDWELRYGWSVTGEPDPSHAADADADGDGMSNREEYLRGTDPTVPDPPLDSDGDGISDTDEIGLTGTNPSDAYSIDPHYDDSYGARGYIAVERWSGFTATLPGLDAFRESSGVNSPATLGLAKTRTLTRVALLPGAATTSGGVFERVRGIFIPRVSGPHRFSVVMEAGTTAGAEALLRISEDGTPFLCTDLVRFTPGQAGDAASGTRTVEPGRRYYYELWLRKPDPAAEARLDITAE